MSNRQPCQALTRQGRACRNAAVVDSDPPACWRHVEHRETTGIPVRGPGRALSAATWPAALTHSDSLGKELAVVRLVLQRLVDRLDEPDFALEADELRKLAALIFSGARTVAYLLQQESGHEASGPAWLNQALDALSAEFEVEL